MKYLSSILLLICFSVVGFSQEREAPAQEKEIRRVTFDPTNVIKKKKGQKTAAGEGEIETSNEGPANGYILGKLSDFHPQFPNTYINVARGLLYPFKITSLKYSPQTPRFIKGNVQKQFSYGITIRGKYTNWDGEVYNDQVVCYFDDLESYKETIALLEDKSKPGPIALTDMYAYSSTNWVNGRIEYYPIGFPDGLIKHLD